MNHKTIGLLIVGIAILAGMVIFIGPGKIEEAHQISQSLVCFTSYCNSILHIWYVDPEMVNNHPFT